jgi:flagellar biosynthesis anti-sigma factor FlgM
MRIDQITTLTETSAADRASGTTVGQANSTPTTSVQTADSGVTLSSQELQTKLAETPDIRQDRVDALRKAMQDGTYQVSNEDLANAIFNTAFQKIP